MIAKGFNSRRRNKKPPNMFMNSDGLFSLVVCMSYRCSGCNRLFDAVDLQEGLPPFVSLKLPTYNAYSVSDLNGLHRSVTCSSCTMPVHTQTGVCITATC